MSAPAAGQQFGPYEILAPIGAGGMGEVFRARDTRLKRIVALKVLHFHQNRIPDRRDRFELEARAISSLNHPHICTLFDVGEQQGARYLVMEYLEGETLGRRLARGRLPVAEALALAAQIGEALTHAHERGLVHRDLKPENIMLCGPKGAHAKLLDFGLVKVAGAGTAGLAGADPSSSTRTLHRSVEGTIAGTLQYMAPEQLDGRDADARSDIFAFGAVLYEMLTGRRAFEGDTAASLISAILRDSPAPVSMIEPMSPPSLERVVRKCLAKHPAERWQTARDLTDELRWIAQSGTAAAAEASQASPAAGKRLPWIIAAVMAGVLGVLGASRLFDREVVTNQAEGRFEVRLPDKTALGTFGYPVLSPDGARIVFPAETAGAGQQLFMRRLDSVEIQALPGTSGATFPFWSPDGRQIAFFADGKLRRIDIAGGSAATIAEAPAGIGGTWSRDGVIVFCPKLDAPLSRVNASGGSPVQITKLDVARHQTSQFFPEFLPDGRHFVFYGVAAGREDEFNGAYLGSLDSPDVTYLFRTMGRILYAPPGYLLFPRGDSLLAQPFDLRKLRTSGEPSLLLERVGHVGAVLASAVTAANGTIAYRSAVETPPSLTWLNRSGGKLTAAGEPADYGNPALSPDETIIAADYREGSGQARALWLLDTARQSKSRLTFDGGDHFNATWSPDGSRIAFTCTRTGTRNLYQKLAGGGGAEEVLFSSAEEKNLEDWSSDGRYLLFNTRVPGQPIEIWALPLFGERKPFRVIAAADNCEQARFSPDGKWIAYTSVELRRQQIFVQDFPPTGGKWQISTAGGIEPQWRRDGRELYFLQGNKLMAVDVTTSGGQFRAATPRALFETSLHIGGRNSYVPARDGQRFLMSVAGPANAATSFTVVTNWAGALRH